MATAMQPVSLADLKNESVKDDEKFTLSPRDPDLISLEKLGESLPDPVARSTPLKWVNSGLVNRKTKIRYHLPTIRLTAGLRTSLSAYDWFIRKISESPDTE